jgi:hypothetical protein
VVSAPSASLNTNNRISKITSVIASAVYNGFFETVLTKGAFRNESIMPFMTSPTSNGITGVYYRTQKMIICGIYNYMVLVNPFIFAVLTTYVRNFVNSFVALCATSGDSQAPITVKVQLSPEILSVRLSLSTSRIVYFEPRPPPSRSATGVS